VSSAGFFVVSCFSVEISAFSITSPLTYVASFDGAVSAGFVFEPSLNGLGGFGFVALFGFVEFFGVAGGLGVACDSFFGLAGGLGLVCDSFFAGAGGLGLVCDSFFVGAGGLGLVCDSFFAGAGGLGVELLLPEVDGPGWVSFLAGLVGLVVVCVVGFVVLLPIPK
jgi:hypothetical protein